MKHLLTSLLLLCSLSVGAQTGNHTNYIGPTNTILYSGDHPTGMVYIWPGVVYVQNCTWNAYACTLFNRMDIQPSSERKGYYSELFDSLQFYKLIDSLDVYVITAAHDTFASLLNLIGDYSNATPVNKPTFVTDQGWAGVVATQSFINTNFSPALNAVRYKSTSCSFGVYVRNNVVGTDAMCVLGNQRSGEPISYNYIFPRTSDLYFVRINIPGAAQPSIASNNTVGFFQVHKLGTTLNISRSGSFTAYTSSSYTSQETPITVPFYIDARQTGGNPEMWATFQVAAYYFGGNLTATQRIKLYQITERFLDNIGAGVL